MPENTKFICTVRALEIGQIAMVSRSILTYFLYFLVILMYWLNPATVFYGNKSRIYPGNRITMCHLQNTGTFGITLRKVTCFLQQLKPKKGKQDTILCNYTNTAMIFRNPVFAYQYDTQLHNRTSNGKIYGGRI